MAPAGTNKFNPPLKNDCGVVLVPLATPEMVADPNWVQLVELSAGKADADPNDNGVGRYQASVAVSKVLEQTLEMSVMITA